MRWTLIGRTVKEPSVGGEAGERMWLVWGWSGVLTQARWSRKLKCLRVRAACESSEFGLGDQCPWRG